MLKQSTAEQKNTFKVVNMWGKNLAALRTMNGIGVVLWALPVWAKSCQPFTHNTLKKNLFWENCRGHSVLFAWCRKTTCSSYVHHMTLWLAPCVSAQQRMPVLSNFCFMQLYEIGSKGLKPVVTVHNYFYCSSSGLDCRTLTGIWIL